MSPVDPGIGPGGGVLVGSIPSGGPGSPLTVIPLVVLGAALAVAVFPAARTLVASAIGGPERASERVDTERRETTPPRIEIGVVNALAGVTAAVVAIGLVFVFWVGVLPLVGFLWAPLLALGLALAFLVVARRRGWWRVG